MVLIAAIVILVWGLGALVSVTMTADVPKKERR